jgi:hypothetical protein
MIIGKMRLAMVLEMTVPLPGMTKEEAEAEVSTDEAKTSFARHVTQHLIEKAEAAGGNLTVNEALISIVEV